MTPPTHQVVFGAIVYWCYKLRKLRRSHTFLPTTLNDLNEFRSTNTHRLSTIYHNMYSNPNINNNMYSNPNINFNDVCQPPVRGVLPRTFSDSLLSRDLGAGKVPLILGD